MSARPAFAPLAGLLNTVSEAVADRARVLYGAARVKAGKGSGHEPASDIMGNIVAYAAVCLHLAVIEIEGPAKADQAAYQRHSTLRLAQYKILFGILQAVLPLQGVAAKSTTPKATPQKRTRSSAKLDAVSDEPGDDPTTPTKASGKRASARASTSRTTPTSAKRITPRSKRVEELAQPSLSSKGKQKMEEDMDEEAGKEANASGSSPRRSTRSVPAPLTVGQEQQTTSTKPSAAKKARIDTSAFDNAISAPAPSPSPSPTKSASAKKAGSAALPVIQTLAEEENTEISEEIEIPYEPYLDDMLIAWRSKKGVRRLLKDTELWRQSMLQKLEGIS